MMVLYALLALLVVGLAGFAVGRRLGYRDGMKYGRSLNKLELREHSLRQGYCLVCDDGRETSRL